MDPIFVALLLVALFHFLLAAVVLPLVFRNDIREWFENRRERGTRPLSPACMYCGSRWTRATDEGSTHWDDNALVLVTGFVCDHCRLPFWHVDRIAAEASRK